MPLLDLHYRRLTVVQLITLLSVATSFAQSGVMGQEGSKGTDAAGAYSISAAAVTTARPVEKTNPAPSLHKSGAKGNSKRGGKRLPIKGAPVNQMPSELIYSVNQDFPQGPPPPGKEYVRIGVTIWRLSASQCPIADCPQPIGNSKGLFDTATRLEDNAPLSTGERVRLGIESLSRNAYVYIIDREQFGDGTVGDPYLIFPTRNINSGSHWAEPGLQIQLPRPDGCFCVKSRNPKRLLVADNLLVIVSPKPLLTLSEIGEKEIPLPVKLSGYIRQAEQARTYRGSLRGGGGMTQTPAEIEAGAKGLFDTTPVLTRSDLPPQNFYQGTVPVGVAAVFSFSLHYASGAKP